MREIEFLNIQNAAELVKKHEHKRIFCFDVDIIGLIFVNHRYGRKKGDKLIEALENFIFDFDNVLYCKRVASANFVFCIAPDTVKSSQEILDQWTVASEKFLNEQRCIYSENNLRLSAGICSLDNIKLLDAIDNAAIARKESRKTHGHDAVVFSPELFEDLNLFDRKELEVNNALSEKRFTFYLQPIVDKQTGKIKGSEALARQIGIDGQIIPPDQFIPIMEQDGSSVELDFFILESVCKLLAKRIKEGRPVVNTAINLSRHHSQDLKTATKLHAIVTKYGLSPKLFNFEINEYLSLFEHTGAKHLIDELRAYGYQISIDDYGAGYTGITVWHDLDFDILKMDKKFLAEDGDLKIRNKVLMPNTINVAKKLNKDIICEGVETLDQCEYLLQWGCTTAQGFYFSKPLPANEFYALYEKTDGFLVPPNFK